MTTQQHSQTFLRKRKFLMVVPLLILPFLVLIFWSLGGGKPSGIRNSGQNQSGINFHLPDAHFGVKKALDKLGLYEEASKDSAKLREAMKNDPYYTNVEIKDSVTGKNALASIFEKSAAKYGQHFENGNLLNNSITGKDENQSKEKDIINKLAILKSRMRQNSGQTGSYAEDGKEGRLKTSESSENPDLSKIEKLLNSSKNSKEGDPDITRLDGMLNKIMAIQHPQTMEDSLRKISEKNSKAVFPVRLQVLGRQVSTLDTTAAIAMENSFYSLQSTQIDGNSRQNAIEAVIQETQSVVSGATVKLRLVNDIFVNGLKIKKDAFIYGTASLSNERLKISINSIRDDDNIMAVALEVYDLDGMAGIYIPGSISRDVSKQSADQAISTIGLTTLDPSVQAQAASAGIQAAKTLVSKKVKLIRVTIKDGYKVLLKDESQK